MKRTPLKRNAMKRKPRKERTVKVDGVRVSIEEPEYLAWLRTQNCFACMQLRRKRGASVGIPQIGGSEAAHVGKGSMGKKCPDREAIPLCFWHHREGPTSEHKLTGNNGQEFWDYWGEDRYEVMAEYRRQYEEHIREI